MGFQATTQRNINNDKHTDTGYTKMEMATSNPAG